MGARADNFDKPWPGAGTGGSPALDFVNTLDWRGRVPPVEMLNGFPDLVRWARTVAILEAGEAAALRTWSEAHPRPAARALAEAIAVREAIAEIVQAIVQDEAVPATPLALLDQTCREALALRTLRPAGAGAMWGWRAVDGAHPEPARPALAVALDAARILTSNERERVRSCGDPECGWYFLDTSRNQSRRWCNMQSCGNRNKVRRFYRRQHG
ncbi:MAG TPA: CGNR zinc finger domain-containing protein [Candidatus Udaeobacter sp.]|nr:CGNR zinc finger domain-containing protein [Candidatus Udaeobacter sp.]